MKKKIRICIWIRNISLLPLIASFIWLASKGIRMLTLYNSTMISGGSGVEIDSFNNTDIYILIVLLISLTVFLISNRIRKEKK